MALLVNKLFLLALGVAIGTLELRSAEIATGDRLQLSDKGFSIIPPQGWEIHKALPNLSLLLQRPYKPDVSYQRTIQVMQLQEPQYIDEMTRQAFADSLIEKFSKGNVAVEGYSLRNHQLTKMADGRDGLLYYAAFELDGHKMMQAHILVSSPSHAYLLTFTDLQEHFEGDAAKQYLAEAWTSMSSIVLAGETPRRFGTISWFGGAGAVTVLGFLVYRFWYRRRPKTYDDELAGDEELLALSDISDEDLDDEDVV